MSQFYVGQNMHRKFTSRVKLVCDKTYNDVIVDELHNIAFLIWKYIT